ncbi:XRE family transcriptional regulator [bacterium D16-51]|nr:XRE family transcriptional regulator [bacterium D16-59]RKI61325.1 XRE family transcriptional regulator [bacterium D16-51]
MTVSENIKRIRKEKGLTQKKLGELCGINEANIRKYENGRQKPKIETLEKIANALGVSYLQLLENYNINHFDPKNVKTIKEQNPDLYHFLCDYANITLASYGESAPYSLETLPFNTIAEMFNLFYHNISCDEDNITVHPLLQPKDTPNILKLLENYTKLNTDGKKEILKRLEELTHLKQYTDK